MSKKLRKRTISSEFLGFYFPEIKSSYNYLSPGFDLLEEKIGNGPLQYVMKYLDYDEWKDTKFCLGFHCSEKVYNISNKNYCNPCWKQMISEEYEMCKKCGLLKDECFHCGECNKINCMCQICRHCGDLYKNCDCLIGIMESEFNNPND